MWVSVYSLCMPNINVKDDVHKRLKQLALDTGETLCNVVHNACMDTLSAAEKKVAEVKKKSTRK